MSLCQLWSLKKVKLHKKMIIPCYIYRISDDFQARTHHTFAHVVILPSPTPIPVWHHNKHCDVIINITTQQNLNGETHLFGKPLTFTKCSLDNCDTPPDWYYVFVFVKISWLIFTNTQVMKSFNDNKVRNESTLKKGLK